MKQTLIPILLLILCSVNLAAQDTIVLDGKKIPKEKLIPYSGLGYEVDLSTHGNNPLLTSPSAGKEMKIINQRIFASKRLKSFAQITAYEATYNFDSTQFLPSSDLKFFDENGNLKWEKKFYKKIPFCWFLSIDGDYSIIEFRTYTDWDPEGTSDFSNSLSIFDEKGSIVCDYPSPVHFSVSQSRDMVCYQEDVDYTHNYEKIKTFYCVDLKNSKQWIKSFEMEVWAHPISKNGDYILAWSDSTYTLYYRDGKEIFNKHFSEFGEPIYDISDDGKYALVFLSSTTDTSYFKIIGLQNRVCFKTNYYGLPEEDKNSHHIYNGGRFVNNSQYLVVFNTIIAPGTSAIIFHTIHGDYIGHKVYHNYYNPYDITLLDDGSFEVYMDGVFVENLTLPGVNTKQYLSKSAE